MWLTKAKKSDGRTKEQILNQELLNNLHSFIVKYREINNIATASQLVDFYAQLNKQFSNTPTTTTTNPPTDI